jgi:heme oxygenase
MHNPEIESIDALAALRGATARQHAILDSGLPLAQPGAGLEDYRWHLLMLRAWLQPIESWLARFDDGPQGEGAPPAVNRSGLIDADLATGPLTPQASGAVRQQGAAWPADASAAYRWGVCYVVEGSQLGGTVLYRRLAGRLAPHPLNYLKGGAEGPGPRWRRFTEALREQVRGSEQIGEACAGARDAFERILALRHARNHPHQSVS